MFSILEPYILSFIPIFVAVDSIGNIPLFLGLVEGVSRKEKKKIVVDSVATAVIVAFLFMLLGKWVFKLLNVTIADFQIAGGALLFVIAIRLLLPGARKNALSVSHGKDIGVFPLGTPLITGPAVLTTTLIMLDTFGPLVTSVSLLANMLIAWGTLARADLIMKILGISGTRIFSKIMYIMLAAIALMMIRLGITGAFLK